MKKKNIVVLSGAGVSQESGIKTFRDSNGLWENHDIMEVASPQGFNDNPELVLEFYNLRRKQLLTVEPNQAHHFLKLLEFDYNVDIITQNVDDLHERAGSSNVLHLHGELLKSRSVKNEHVIFEQTEDINLGDLAPDGGQLRPHIVWFGEAVPNMIKAAEITQKADILIVIGTSLQVYPAASLIDYVPHGNPIYIVEPNEIEYRLPFNAKHIKSKAVEACATLEKELL